MHSKVNPVTMNVVVIDVDSLRADHVGVYEYDAPTTPNLDELANDSVKFENAYVSNSPCLPSRAAFISGRHGISNGVETHGPASQQLRSPQNWRKWYACWAEEWTEDGRATLLETEGESKNWLTLPEVFFHNRIHTGAISSFPRHTAPWFYHLWHEYHQPQEPDRDGEYMQTPRAETIADLGIEFISQNKDDDFFLYTQFWDPHTPYNRNEEEIERFRGTPLPPYPTEDQLQSHQEWNAWRSASQMGIHKRDDLEELLAHYDAEIRYMDSHLGRILDHLKENGLYEDSLIVVTADHGEEFGEHGVYREHWSTYEGTQRVPLIIKPPESVQVSTGTRSDLVTNVDIAPTLVDYADLEIPGGWQGKSLRPLIEEENTEWRDSIVFDHGLYTAQRSIRSGRWKLTRTYHPGMWESVLPRLQLYNLDNDPWEQNDVAENNPDVVTKLEQTMSQWVADNVGRYGDPIRDVARETPPGTERQQRWNNWSGV